MFDLRLHIRNPFCKDKFKNLCNKSALIAKHKAVELELVYYSPTVLEIDTSYSVKCDHAGFRLTLGLFRYSICVNYYDTRHWDYESECWQTYE